MTTRPPTPRRTFGLCRRGRHARQARAFFAAEALFGLAFLTLIAASAAAAVRWHLRAISIDGQRNQALLTIEQSLDGLRQAAGSQPPSAVSITIDPAIAPRGYHWVHAVAGSGRQSVALFALVPIAPKPTTEP
jgi:hypothetical protein